MSSFELNKVLGAVLVAVLTMVVIGKIGDNLVTTGGGHGGGHGSGHGDATVTAKAKPPKVKAPLEPIVGLLASADAAAGQKVAAKCRACHDVKKDGKNKIGPNLWNIVNAKRGAVDGFSYSKALTEKPGGWTYESLNAFLAKPKDYIAGTKMSFAGIKKVKDRANLIAYLRAAADSPAALPTQAEIDAAAKALEAAKQAAADAVRAAAAPMKAAAANAAHGAKDPMAKAAPAVAKMDIAAMLGDADPARGKKVFNKCKACHTVNNGGKNGIGPNLWNIVNRAPGGVSGFKYSSALAGLSAKPWNYENLNAFLLKPKVYAKGTKMTFAGLKKDSDRAHLIAYLRSLSDSPAPLK
jgi:cytochrome c